MDHDQEKYYEAEEQQPQETQAQQEKETEVNDMVYFIELLKHLRALIDQGRRIPLTKWVMINADDCGVILDSLDENLPDAIQYGIKMYSDRDRIMGNAEDEAIRRLTTANLDATKTVKNAEEEANRLMAEAKEDSEYMLDEAEKEAKNIINEARERADVMVSESEIVCQARDEARTIRNDAHVAANETVLRANHEAFMMVSEAEETLDKALKEMRRLSNKLNDEKE